MCGGARAGPGDVRAGSERSDRPGEGRYRRADAVLVMDDLIHDFGEVRPGKDVRWTFKIKNVGDADLVIHSVAPS